MSRTYRKEYKGEEGKRFDRDCRNNGHRPHCTDDKLYSDTKWREATANGGEDNG